MIGSTMSSNEVYGCTHGMPNPKTCVDCMEDGVMPPPPKWYPGPAPWIVAQHDGICPGCDQIIGVGDYIKQWEKRDGKTVIDTKYLHTECEMK